MLDINEIWRAIRPKVLGMLGAPTAYTPVWTAETANPAIGNGTLVGRYVEMPGKLCRVQVYMLAGSQTTYGTGNWGFTLPFPAAAAARPAFGTARIYDASPLTRHIRTVQINPGQTELVYFILDNSSTINLSSSVPITWTNGDALEATVIYERE